MKSLNKITDYIQNSFFKVLLVVGMLLPLLVMAQLPVQVNGNLFPPYSVKLSDYATANSDRLVFNLLLRDVNEFNRQVTLKLSIEGNNGFSARSTDVIIGENPITLNGGVPKRLTNIDLRPYFQLENLVGISPQQYSKPLAAGLYQFCFEVYDYLSGQQLGEKGCATAYIVLNDPPILNMPGRGENVAFRDSQNIIFQWTPRHINATNVQYEFTLVEIWDTNIDPQAAFLAGRPLYQTTTRSTTLLYGPAETPLLPDKTYGWRVQAIVTDGISELSLFKNKGYSEIFHFNYTKQCTPPQFVLAESNSNSSAMVYWQGVDHSQYQIQYRKKDGDNANWYEVNSYSEQARIQRLQENTTYEYRVGGKCGENGGYTFSRLFEFTTTTRGGSDFTCGVTPEQHIDNQEPLQTLVVNEVFTAGEFPITVKRVTAGNTEAPAIGEIAQGGTGRFSGWGYITVPYLADTKIKIGFVDIKINTDYELVDGVLVTDYDPNWSGMDDVSDELENLEAWMNSFKDIINDLVNSGKLPKDKGDRLIEQVNNVGNTINEAQQLDEEAESILEQADKAESPEKEQLQEEAQALKEEADNKKEIAEKEKKELDAELDKIKKDLGLNENDTNAKVTLRKDSVFDGVFSYGNGKEFFKHIRIDNQEVVDFSNTDDNPSPDQLNYTFSNDGKIHQIIVTHSGTPQEMIEDARHRASNPNRGELVMYFHYDTKAKEIGYKVNFDREYFDKLTQKDYEAIAELHAQALFNMLQGKELTAGEIIKIFKDATLEVYSTFKQVLYDVKLPEELWDQYSFKNEEYYMESLSAGLVDGAIDEIKSIPLLISIVVDYTTDEKTRNQINQAILNIDIEKIYNKFVDERSDLYNGPNIHKIKHQTGKDIVAAGTLLGTGGIAALGKVKKGVDFIENLVENAGKLVDDAVVLLAKFPNIRKSLEEISPILKTKGIDRYQFEDVIRRSDNLDYLEENAELLTEIANEIGKGKYSDEDLLKIFKDAVNGDFVKDLLPKKFVNSLKKFGKSEEEIFDYFRKYHNVHTKGDFFKSIEDILVKSNTSRLARDEAYAIWGYTTNFFYGDLNRWLREGKNIVKTKEISELLDKSIRKLPKYSGNAFRAIELDGKALTAFLAKHQKGMKVPYDEFTSAGSSKGAAFFDKPSKNVKLIMEVKDAPDISDFADGIKFRGYQRKELLLPRGSEFQVTGRDFVNGIYEIRLIQIK